MHRTTPCLALALLTLTGCVSQQNLRPHLGRGVTLSTLPPRVIEPELDAEGRPHGRYLPQSDGPSVVGVDRSNFGAVAFVVPVDGVRHEPHATRPVRLTRSTARQRGEFPDAAAALETTHNDALHSESAEILVAPLWASVEAVVLIPRLLIEPFLGPAESPDRIKGRTPVRGEIGPGGVITVTPWAPPETEPLVEPSVEPVPEPPAAESITAHG
jgi:hypothetical protein